MEAVLITVYLIIVIAMIAVILLQRSEGGGLGMGGNPSGLITVRGSANLLTRTTAVLAALFMATAIGLTIMSELDRGTRSILQRAADGVGEGVEAPTTVLDALNNLQSEMSRDGALAVPDEGTAPAGGTAQPAAEPAADPALAVPSVDGAGEDGTAAEGDQPAADDTPAAPVN